MDFFLNTIELSKSLTDSSLEKIKKELEDNSSEIEFDQIIMLKIITSFLRQKQVK
jgi:hypothetical protein